MTETKEFTLEAEPRTGCGKGVARKLRAQGKIPVILYGDDKPPEPLAVDRATFEKLVHKVAGESMLINLKIKGTDKEEKIFIKAAQRDPVTDEMIHADFYRVSLSKKIRMEVPVHAGGVAIGVKKGGILETLLRSVEIRCLPLRIPKHFSIDISNLEINHSIHVRDIVVDPDIEILTPPDTPLFTVVPPKVEAEVAPTAEAAAGEKVEAAEPEVIGKGKAEKEEEEEETEKEKK